MNLIDRFLELQSPMKILHHNVITINIALDGDDAEGKVYMIAPHRVRGPDGPFDVLFSGRYFENMSVGRVRKGLPIEQSWRTGQVSIRH